MHVSVFMCRWRSPTLRNGEVRLVELRADQEQMLFSYKGLSSNWLLLFIDCGADSATHFIP